MIDDKDSKRIHQSALQKRKALLEISKGKNAKEVIINQTNSKDKKYASKMLYKWKKEIFSKKPDMQQFGFGNDLSDVDIDFELNAFNFDIKKCKKNEKNSIKCFEKGYVTFSNCYSMYNNSEFYT